MSETPMDGVRTMWTTRRAVNGEWRSRRGEMRWDRPSYSGSKPFLTPIAICGDFPQRMTGAAMGLCVIDRRYVALERELKERLKLCTKLNRDVVESSIAGKVLRKKKPIFILGLMRKVEDPQLRSRSRCEPASG